MKCISCGAEIDDAAKFCPYCGAETGHAQPDEDRAETAPLPPVKEKPVYAGMLEGIAAFVRCPSADTDPGLVPALLISAVSWLTHTWMMYSVLAVLLRVLLTPFASLFGGTLNIGRYMTEFGYGFGSFLSGGFVVSLLLLAFMMTAVFLSGKAGRDLRRIFCIAAGSLAVPTLVLLLSCVAFQFSVLMGVLVYTAGVALYLVTMTGRLPDTMHIYLKALIVTLFAVLLAVSFGSAFSLPSLISSL